MEPLHTRIQPAMKLRGLSRRTQEAYLAHVKRLAAFHRRCPSRLGLADIESFLLHMSEDLHLSAATRNQCAGALRFVYRYVLARGALADRIPFAKKSHPLPDLLSVSEIREVLGRIPNSGHRTIALLCVGAGLRLGEACSLKIADIDSEHRVIHVRNGKGQKDRLVAISDQLLKCLRAYWRQRRPQGPFLFPGKVPERAIHPTSVEKALTLAGLRAGIMKRIYPHLLRHCYATRMLEMGGDIRTLQLQLGHAGIQTTARYLHITHARRALLPNPLDGIVPADT